MLEREPMGSGWQVTLHAKGVLRFLPAAFLMFWLCGWAVGEYFAGGMMLALVGHALGQHDWTSWLPVMKGVPPERPVQLAFAAFLTFWLTFWTWGGLSAFGQLVGLLCGREQVLFDGDTLELKHVAFVTLRRTRIEVSAIRAITRQRMAIMIETRRKRYAVGTLGSVDECDELEKLLREWHAQYRRPVSTVPDGSPVEGYRVEPDETGAPSLVTSMAFQRGLGLVLLAIGMGAGYMGSVIAGHGDSPGRWGGVLVAALFCALFSYAGGWLTFVRESWHPRAGALELRRLAFGHTWATVFMPLSLAVVASTDSDGDSRWVLEVKGEGQRRNLLSSTNDPNPPRAMGEWLAQATGVPLTENGEPSGFERAS